MLALVAAAPVVAAPPPVAPKLYVVIAMDQFSAALYAQYRDRFSGGLKRLGSGIQRLFMDEGVILEI